MHVPHTPLARAPVGGDHVVDNRMEIRVLELVLEPGAIAQTRQSSHEARSSVNRNSTNAGADPLLQMYPPKFFEGLGEKQLTPTPNEHVLERAISRHLRCTYPGV